MKYTLSTLGHRSRVTVSSPLVTRHTMLTAMVAVLGASLLVLSMTGCASTPPPTAQMAVSNAALAHAVAAGSVELAPTEMAMARDKMMRANQSMANKDYDTALTLAQQAQLDAQVAEAKAEAAKAGKSVTALQEASRALREEMARKTP